MRLVKEFHETAGLSVLSDIEMAHSLSSNPGLTFLSDVRVLQRALYYKNGWVLNEKIRYGMMLDVKKGIQRRESFKMVL